MQGKLPLAGVFTEMEEVITMVSEDIKSFLDFAEQAQHQAS